MTFDLQCFAQTAAHADGALATAAVPPPAASTGQLGRMLDIVPHGMLLLDAAGEVAFANQAAQRELDAAHPLQLDGSALRARRAQDRAQLDEALVQATQRGLQRLLVVGGGALDEVVITVAPAGGPRGGECRAAMLVLGRRKVCDDLLTEAYARQCRLTPTETTVLKHLCAGSRPGEIARGQGVALSTVRTQIGSIRTKTGTGDLRSLLRRVALLPPLACALHRGARAAA